MGTKMVNGFMITCRPFGRLPHFPIIAAAFGLLMVSCEKVPLLAPSSASITLTASATVLPLNGTTDLVAQVLEQAGATPNPVSANGGGATIAAKVTDASGNALPNVPVTFTTDAGSLSGPVVNTDASGIAQTTLTTNKTAKVTATAGVSSGTPATSPSATVTVNVNVAPTITVGSPSPAVPPVGQSVTFPLTYGTDANSSPIQTVSVDFGDGSRQTIPGKPSSVSHIYTASGSYSVRATAT